VVVKPVLEQHSRAISALVKHSTLCGPSSVALGWEGIAIERHAVEPRERPEVIVDHHLLVRWGKSPTDGERAGRRGRFVPYRKMPGSITTCVPGPVPTVRAFNRYEAVFCALSPEFVSGIEHELDRRPFAAIHELYGAADPSLQHLISLLIEESEAGGPNGRLYADSLSVALATRLIHAGHSALQPGPNDAAALPKHRLRRVLDRIHNHFHMELNLAELAAEAGYSRSHFIRMFRAAIGRTPHRYLLDYRLDRAREMLARDSRPLTEVAAACGFANHAHFSTAFRARFDVAPSDSRRRRS
jgi:AraC family transcriptional regulator